ncbi:hypothetical protein C8Q73DRAFT_432144 [Cubamyces lactineus]|nr:hypothetical protein C8Q73DRAFT_432144 [Cubamyces lactineus]
MHREAITLVPGSRHVCPQAASPSGCRAHHRHIRKPPASLCSRLGQGTHATRRIKDKSPARNTHRTFPQRAVSPGQEVAAATRGASRGSQPPGRRASAGERGAQLRP